MKATRGETEPAFKPITITLETEGEARYIYECINFNADIIPVLRRKGIETPYGLPHNMYEVLSQVYAPYHIGA